jgi:RND family efflux transporter MFP subunit
VKRIIAPLLTLTIGLAPFAIAACKKGEDAQAAQGGKGGRGMRGEGGLVFAVDILKAEQKKLDYIVTAPGTIEAFERVQVTSRVAGVVDRVSFAEGQEVKKGAVLVAIDAERYLRAVNSAKAALEKAQAAQKDTEAMVTRREGASEKNPGLIPGEELETFRTKSLTAKADTAVAAENLKLAELNLRDSAVRAPIDGVIQTRTVETGQYVQTGYVMATLLQAEPMLLRFQVEPLEAPRLKPGQIANFTMRETQRSFTAKLTLVAGSADPSTHMVGVTGEVADEGHKYWLRPGSFCDVQIDVGATRDAVVIPRQAMRATDKGYVVYVVDGEATELRTITIGMSSKEGMVEVRSGLTGDEWVVVRGAEALSAGARVRATKLASLDAGTPPISEPPTMGGGAGGGGAGGAPGGPPGADGGGRKRRGDAAVTAETTR